MKVLHVSTATTWRGGEQQIVWLMDELAQMNVAQLIVCTANSEMEKYCRKNQIACSAYSKKSAVSFSFIKGLKKSCRDFNPDLIHLHDSHAHTAGVLAHWTGGIKAPMVLSRRVDFPVSQNIFSKYKYNYPAIQKIICVSDAINTILSKCVRDAHKLVAVHSGVDFSRINPLRGKLRQQLGIAEGEILIGNIAALAPHKDHFTFLRTASILKKQIKARFVIAGDGPMKNEIQNAIREMQLEQDVFLLGFRDDVHEIIGDFDFFLFTSETEGLGTSLIDAMYARVPVVATSVGGIPELIQHGEHGLLAPPGDTEQLAAHILTCVNHPELKTKFIENAYQHALLFSKKNTALKTLDVYNSILKQLHFCP